IPRTPRGQIHTHTRCSEFNDIIKPIADTDTDVISIETSRCGMELLDAIDNFRYPNETGSGVCDICSPGVPIQEHVVQLMQEAVERTELCIDRGEMLLAAYSLNAQKSQPIHFIFMQIILLIRLPMRKFCKK
ncbi:MAG: hypothetical protein ACOY3V_02175, partial [Pseudomonadota bacterium]